MKLFEKLSLHRKIISAFFIVLNQLAEFFNIQRQIVFGRIAFRIRGLEFFKRLAHAGGLQNCFFNL